MRQRIAEIQLEEQELANDDNKTLNLGTLRENAKRKKLINHDAVQLSVEFNMPAFKTLLIDELTNYSEWMNLNFSKLNITRISKKSES